MKNPSSTATNQQPTVVGHGLPVDIPIEAANRIPPPRYAAVSMNHNGRSSRSQGHGSNVSNLPPPPPYTATSDAVAGTINVAVINISREEPPMYRSRVGLNSSATIVGGEPGGLIGRQLSSPMNTSIDSFVEFPSMVNILQTSSRSSLHGTDSRHYSQSDRSSNGTGTAADSAAAGVSAPRASDGPNRLSAGDSARGDSLDDATSATSSNLVHSHRTISSSSSALHDVGMTIPDRGIQKKVLKSKRSTKLKAEQETAALRSCPSLDGFEGDPPPMNGTRRPRGPSGDSPESHDPMDDDSEPIPQRRNNRYNKKEERSKRRSTRSGELGNSERDRSFADDSASSCSIPQMMSSPQRSNRLQQITRTSEV